MPDKTVAVRTFAPNLTIPANTPSTVPVSLAVPVGKVVADEVRLIIPSGHAFLTGIAVEYKGTRVLPWDDPPAWFVGDDDDQVFPLDLQIDSALTLVGYNTDIYSHTFHLRIKVHDFAIARALVVPTMIPNGQIVPA